MLRSDPVWWRYSLYSDLTLGDKNDYQNKRKRRSTVWQHSYVPAAPEPGNEQKRESTGVSFPRLSHCTVVTF